MRIYNTLTKKKEPFKPLVPGKIGMYLCGPTVYDYGHIGHARSAIAFDVIRRYFLLKGFAVTFVSNFTDVDDKIINRAKERGQTESALSEEMIQAYQEDYGKLGIMKSDVAPKATEHIQEMIDLITQLEKKRAVYEIEFDGIYFDLKKYKEYGKLSGQKLAKLKKEARHTVAEGKKHPHDFCLWKYQKPGEPFWNAPWQAGRPGWHIECSAMCLKHLGKTLDIHAGGQDLIFPHHENEIAQSETANGAPFARYWMHNGFVTVDNEKMSKSLGNFFTIRDVLKKYDARTVRFFLLSTQYRQPINFADTLLDQAKNGLERLYDFMGMLTKTEHIPGTIRAEVKKALATAQKGFENCMDDDFDISGALGHVFDCVKEIYRFNNDKKLTTGEAKQILGCIKKVDSVLNVLAHKEENIDADIKKLIAQREAARKKKDWKTADKIRDELAQQGIRLDDTPDGAVWKRR